jgi:hypothetical protein
MADGVDDTRETAVETVMEQLHDEGALEEWPRTCKIALLPFTPHERAALDPLLHRVDGGLIRVWAAAAGGRRHRICSPWHRLESLRRY